VGRGDDVVAAGRAAAAARPGGAPSRPAATFRVDVALSWATPDARPDGGARIGVHHGTRESAARLVELGGRFFQLRLEEPIVPLRGDRLVIRSLAPPDTLGGGVVLDPGPRRHGPSRDLLARLAALERGEEPVEAAPAEAPEPEAELPPVTAEAEAVEARLREAGAEPPLDSELDRDALSALRAHDRAVRLGPTMHVHPEALAEVQARLTDVIRREGSITLARARDELGTSRKYAQAYLEHLDAAHVTLRRGDERVLRRGRASA
jgi:selenocysteine-specific elongation factor